MTNEESLKHFISQDYLAEYGRSDYDEVDWAIKITHWMPLPEPPEEEKK